jgi:hypothetical protein
MCTSERSSFEGIRNSQKTNQSKKINENEMLRSKKKQEKLFIASVMFVVQLSIELKILPTGGITFL